MNLTINLNALETDALTAAAAARGQTAEQLVADHVAEVVTKAVASYAEKLKTRAETVWRTGTAEQRAALVDALNAVDVR